jgi:hypothetical protein
MDQPARLYLCARCRIQVVLCSRCDRGNRYCGRACRHQAREDARRQTAQRYQRSWHGRMAHAQRSRRWRQRRAAAAGRGSDVHNVTHQGSQPGVRAAPLAAWTHDTASTDPHTTAAASAPQHIAAQTCWYCRRCGTSQPARVRQGFLRHGPRAVAGSWVLSRRRHDHSP